MFVKIPYTTNENVKVATIEFPDTATVGDLKMIIQRRLGIGVDRIASIRGTYQDFEKWSDILERWPPGKRPNEIMSKIGLFENGKFLGTPDFYGSTRRGTMSKSTRLFPKASLSRSSRKRSFAAMLDERDLPPKRPKTTAGLTDDYGYPPSMGRIDSTMMPVDAMKNARACKRVPSSSESDVADDDDKDDKCLVNHRDCCQLVKCGLTANRPPHMGILPEDRQYCVVISHGDPCADKVDIEAILNHLFVKFETCEVAHLKFSQCLSMAPFDSNLLIACTDNTTVEWMIDSLEDVCPPHDTMDFLEFFNLSRVTFVLPLVNPDKMLCAVFEQLEIQNKGLLTDKWSVTRRRILCPRDPDFYCKQVSTLYDGDEIEVYIDDDSRDYLQCNCNILKYSFWHLHFVLCCDSSCK